MRAVLMTALSTAALAFVAATPVMAQDTVSGAPARQAPVTVEGYGYMQGQTGQPGIGNNYPPGYRNGYDNGYYSGPFGPIGAAFSAFGSGLFGAADTVTSGAVGVAEAPFYAGRHHCHVYRDDQGRRICGP